MRLNAYYFAFDSTGIAEIDVVLSAVACAGKAFHHTEAWREPSETYEPCHRGETPADWIQNAANDAAKEVLRLRSIIPTCSRGPKACDAELDSFKARTVELAKALSRAIDHIADSCSDHPIVEELDNILLGKAPEQSSEGSDG